MCIKWRISSCICFSTHMLFDLIAMKIHDEEDQFTEFNEILNFLKKGNFPIYGCINMEILKYASPRIKDPFLTTPSSLLVCMWSVEYADSKGCGPNFHENRCNKFAECCLHRKFKDIRKQTCCLKAQHSFAQFILFRKDGISNHWYSNCLLILEKFQWRTLG